MIILDQVHLEEHLEGKMLNAYERYEELILDSLNLDFENYSLLETNARETDKLEKLAFDPKLFLEVFLKLLDSRDIVPVKYNQNSDNWVNCEFCVENMSEYWFKRNTEAN